MRFSSVATGALACVAVAGGVMTLLIIDDVDDLTDTVWGRRLTVKLIGVGVATLIGAYHHVVTVPRLAAPEGAGAIELARARTTLVLEALALGVRRGGDGAAGQRPDLSRTGRDGRWTRRGGVNPTPGSPGRSMSPETVRRTMRS